MWISTRYGCFSIACAYTPLGAIDPQTVMVRAQDDQHLRNLQERFPNTEISSSAVVTSEFGEYRFRLFMPKMAWVKALSEMAAEQTWSNFKNEASALPVCPALTSMYISNLRVVSDRKELLTLLPANGVVAEVGVDEGNYSEQIRTATSPKRLHLIDAWASRHGETKFKKVQARFSVATRSGQVVINKGVSWHELAKFPDAYLDWVYIDSSHSYEDTVRELQVCRLKVKPNGLIGGHDYTMGNVAKSLRYGVVPAVNSFCIEQGWEMIYITHEANRYLSYVLRKM